MSDTEENKSTSESDAHLAMGMEHFSTGLQYVIKSARSVDRARVLELESKLEAVRERANSLTLELQEAKQSRREADNDCVALRAERDVLYDRIAHLNAINTTNADTFNLLQKELARSHTNATDEQKGRMADLNAFHLEVHRLQETVREKDAALAANQTELLSERNRGEALQREKEALRAELLIAKETLEKQGSDLETLRTEGAQSATEVARLKPIAEYNTAIVNVWKDMSIKGKLLVARELLDKKHPFYEILEKAPGLMEACADQKKVQGWWIGNRTQFQEALTDFPIQLGDTPSPEEHMAGEVLREFQDVVNRSLVRAGIRIISPKHGDPIGDECTVSLGSKNQGSHSGIVDRCIRNGYYYNGVTIRAIVQPILLNAPEELEGRTQQSDAGEVNYRIESETASDAWFGHLTPISSIHSNDSHVQETMNALETLIDRARQRAGAPIDYSLLTNELRTIAPLFTGNYRPLHPQNWLDIWKQVLPKAHKWLGDGLGIERFSFPDNTPFDEQTMLWDATPTDQHSSQPLIERTSIVGFRVLNTGETVLKAAVTPRRKKG